MMLVMLVTLYTTRIVLSSLGVEDYGIFSVVGGIVTMFSFLSGTMASASQRYFAFELGKNNFEQLQKTFNMSIIIYAVIAIIILIFAETIGLWFLNTKINIPAERLDAARWVYHFSILSFIFTILAIPYNALIIAYEDMKIYAYVGIVEVILKLAIVYLLLLISFDKLKLYSVLMFVVTLMITFTYRIICKKKYNKGRFIYNWDNKLFKEILTYSGWNLFGSISSVVMGQGINILLNVFFNPTINAARGISFQISMAIKSFSNNFYTAVKPQVTKYYAQEDMENMNRLVIQSSKFSFFLLLLLSVPIINETPKILELWLKEVPDYTVLFTQLLIVNILLESLSNPLRTVAQATGNVKIYQSIVGGLQIMNLPISYIFLKNGFQPEVTFIIAIIISLICLFARLMILRNLVQFDIKRFSKSVLAPITLVSVLSFGVTIPSSLYIINSTMGSLLSILICIVSVGVFVFFIGLNRNEKNVIIRVLKKIKLNDVSKLFHF
tara:strand:+ start:3014 stop:4501 length:1488 start_codon:yes stop_codon:yes gene_type:complete